MLRRAMRLSAVPAAWLLACVLVAGMTACKDEPKPGGEPATNTVACINTTCPIMGSPIDSAKVPVSLTRDFYGRKVGFCCASCLPTWDKLTEKEKTTKLAAAMPKPEK